MGSRQCLLLVSAAWTAFCGRGELSQCIPDPAQFGPWAFRQGSDRPAGPCGLRFIRPGSRGGNDRRNRKQSHAVVYLDFGCADMNTSTQVAL